MPALRRCAFLLAALVAVSSLGAASAAPASADAPAMSLSVSSASVGRTVEVTVTGLRANTRFTLFTNANRSPVDPARVALSSMERQVALATSDRRGTLRAEFTVSGFLYNSHFRDVLLRVKKTIGSEVAPPSAWLTVTAPRDLMTLDTAFAVPRQRVLVVVTGLRSKTRYTLFTRTSRVTGKSDQRATSSVERMLASARSSAGGTLTVAFLAPPVTAGSGSRDILISVKKTKGGEITRPSAWLTMTRKKAE